MKMNFPAFLLLFTLFVNGVSAQENFRVEIRESGIQGLPAVHSGVFTQFDGKWILIGGRINGLHGFLPPSAFPASGINDSIWIVDPVNWNVWSSPVSGLPIDIREPVSSSNMQFFRNDSILYLTGGYGWKSSVNDFRTFPTLTAIQLKGLIYAVINQLPISPYFESVTDPYFAVCGGNMGKLDSSYFLAFGHRFDGIYNREDSLGFFDQEYIYEIKRFKISHQPNLTIQKLPAFIDSVDFRRRDYNLIPQVFSDGSYGYTAFSGVFRKGVNIPFFNTVDMDSDTFRARNDFHQDLNQYQTAVIPLYDATGNIMHTLFFGGMAMYYQDTVNNQLATDSLIPFVKTISQISRFGNDSLSEYLLEARMPGFLGTNAYFFPHRNISTINQDIIDLNSITGKTIIGYIIGGIESPDANISDTDPTLSFASKRVFEIYLNKNPVGKDPILKTYPFSLKIFPNPSNTEFNLKLSVTSMENIQINILDDMGRHIINLYDGLISEKQFKWRPSGLTSGYYFCELKTKGFRKLYPLYFISN